MARPSLPFSLKRRSGAWRGQRGQVFAVVAISMVGMCGMSGLVVDVGSWYQAHRKQVSIADAAALVAAGDLPNTSHATIDAITYASKNGGSLSGADVSFSSTYSTNDTVTVTTTATAPSYFLGAFGVGSASVGATSTASAVALDAASGAAPLAIYKTQPELTGCGGNPCWGTQTTLTYNQVGPGGFEIIDIDGSSGGQGPSTLADWIENGCSCSTAVPTWLYSDAGAKFNSSQVGNALDQRIGSILLFPVYDNTQGGGSNMEYHVIGFVGFKVTGYNFQGSNNGTITGSFQQASWQGKTGSSSPGPWSATTVQLTN